MDKIKIYNKLPIFAQNMACYYEGKKIKKNRYGQSFWKYLNEYEGRKNWSYEQLSEFRDTKLRQMIKHCYETVPYYRNLFNDGGINYESIKSIDDLKVLPLLTKQTVNENFKHFISTAIPQKEMVISHTSGTTGSGFKFYTTNETLSEQWAVWWRYRRNLGIKLGDWCALFGSKLIVPVTQSNPPYWRINKPCNQIYFSAFHEKDDNLYHYFNEIKDHKLNWIHGFPSLITLLASFIVNNNLNLGYKIEFITTGAENLLDYQKNIIEEAFGAKIYQHYGLAEGVSNFSQIKNGEMIIDEDFAVTELIPSAETNSIIGTNLTNYAMPLIRYETKDTANYKIDKISRKRIIIAIDGRNEDYITLQNGIKVGKLDHAFKDTINFKEVQICQGSDYNITIYVVKRIEDVSTDEDVAMKLLRKSLGHYINIKFKYVDQIPRTSGGKLRFVKSEIK